MGLETKEAWRLFNIWYKEHRTSSRDYKQEFVFLKKVIDETLLLMAYNHKDLMALWERKRGYKVSRSSEDTWKEMVSWHKKYRHKDRGPKEEFVFLQTAIDKILFLAAEFHRDVRAYEGEKESLVLMPGQMGW